MAQIVGSNNDFIVTIGGSSVRTNKRFAGLHESQDGDTNLKYGEATIMRNCKVTNDNNLKRRGGTIAVTLLGDEPVQGLWCGSLNGEEMLVAACANHLWKIVATDEEHGEFDTIDLGLYDTTNRTAFFPFNKVLYLINGVEYMQFDGERLSFVEGYRPLVAVATPPAGGGELLEQVNKLNGLRRQWFSPDGTAVNFQLAEKDIISVDYILWTANGNYIAPTEYTYDRETGIVTFVEAPENGTSTIEIGYSASTTYRQDVTKMTRFELYSGAQNTRVFLYGDGSNEYIYSSLDYDGLPRADYFPDLNEGALGSANSAIKGMVNHNSVLIVYKEDSAYSMVYGLQENALGNAVECFYGTLINDAMGSANPFVELVDSKPRTLFGKSLYEWVHTSYYSSALTSDERDAKRISDRIYYTLGTFDFKNCFCWDDNERKEYYIVNPATKEALIHNYMADAWYKYTNFDMYCACLFHGDVLLGTSDGRILRFTDEAYNDCGTAIDTMFKTGAMSMDAPFRFKNTTHIFVTNKPETHGQMLITVESDRKSNYTKKPVYSRLIDYGDIDYGDFSYDVNRASKSNRLKIKCKKYEYLYLVIQSNSLNTSFTVNEIDIKAAYGGYSK